MMSRDRKYQRDFLFLLFSPLLACRDKAVPEPHKSPHPAPNTLKKVAVYNVTDSRVFSIYSRVEAYKYVPSLSYINRRAGWEP